MFVCNCATYEYAFEGTAALNKSFVNHNEVTVIVVI